MPEAPDQRLIDELYRELKGRPGDANGNGHRNHAPSALSTEQVVERCRIAENAPKFASLYDDGNLSEHDGDDSVADAALLSILAFYTQDRDQLDHIFRKSALYREKWERADYRRRTIDFVLNNLRETYSPPGMDKRPKNLSSLSSPYRGSDNDDTSDEVPGLVCFAHKPVPDPVDYLLEKAVPLGYVTNLHGAGGFGKSVLAMLVALSVSGYQKECLGLTVRKCGKVLYLDSELDERGQHPRVREICRGLGVPVPEGLHYLSALGLDTQTTFERTRLACEKLGITLLVIDSWGPLMDGNMESAQDIIRFYNNYLKPLVDLGVTVLVVDHQSRTQDGQNYQRKGAFGSVYKENLARSVLQIERVEEDREAGTLRVRVRHRKSNFGPRLEPFDVVITFDEGKITTKAEAIEEAEKAGEETVGSRDRVLAAVKNGPLTVKDLAANTGLAPGTVRNKLSELVPDTLDTADLDGRTKVYGYPGDVKNLSSSPEPPKGNDNDDRSGEEVRPLSSDLKPGDTAELGELKARRLLANQPSWLQDQIEHARKEGFPAGQLKALAAAVAAQACGDATKGPEVLPVVEAFLTHGLGCECEECA